MEWETTIPADQLLGVGLYTPSEAAQFARVRPQQLLRWIHGSRRGHPVVTAQFQGHREIVSFLDMIQALAIREMRYRKRVPLGRIREAVDFLQNRHPEIKYPFARQHSTYIIEREKHIAIALPGEDPECLYRVSGRHHGQLVHAKILDEYLSELEFGGDNLARRFVPMSIGSRRIVLDPEVRFGQPRVEPSGHLVQTLVGAYEAEGSTKAVAWWYDIGEADVRIALRYQGSLAGPVNAKAS